MIFYLVCPVCLGKFIEDHGVQKVQLVNMA